MISPKILQLTIRNSFHLIKPQPVKARFNLHRTYPRSFSTSLVRKMSNDQFQLSNLFNVKDKVALVTGGGSGIGLMVSCGYHTQPTLLIIS